MSHTIREYHRPSEVDEAAALLQREGVSTATLVVGPRVPDEPLAGVEAVVDLSRLGLDFIKETAEGWVNLGAVTALQALADSRLLQTLASGIVAEAARLAGGSAMRQAATVGGVVMQAREAAMGRTREGPPELVLALLVLNAEVVLEHDGGSMLDLADYLTAAPESMAAGGLVTGVRFRRLGGEARASLARVARTPSDQAIVASAALVGGDEVRVSVAAGGTPPLRLTALEQALAGQPLTDVRLAGVPQEVEAVVTAQSDFRASAEYRRAMAGVLVQRALAKAARRDGRQ